VVALAVAATNGLQQADPTTAIDIEYRLGEYLGLADQRRTS
jgi:hypothetical protein